LFVYLFSNERASVCGLYELPLRIISFETGLDREEIKKGLEVFDKADKAHYDFEAGVVWVVNMTKYQGTSSPKVQARIKADIDNVPACDLKKRFLDTVSVRYEDGIDTSISIESQSISQSDSSLKEEKPEKTKYAPALCLFTDRFGKFHNEKELKRWLVIVDAVGAEQAETIAEWADKKEIHLTNRPGLLDSLETAAKHWHEKQQSKQTKTFAEQLAEA
jgi:hypothetical protein